LYSLIHLKVHGQVLYIDACPIPPAGLVPAMYNLVYEKDDFSSLKRWLNKWILMNYSHLDCLRWCCVKTNTRERLPFSFSPKTRIFIEHLHGQIVLTNEASFATTLISALLNTIACCLNFFDFELLAPWLLEVMLCEN